MPVVDASVLVEYGAGGLYAAVARRQLLGSDEEIWAPHLVDAEVGHALRAHVARGHMKPAAAAKALDDLVDLPIQRAPHATFLRRAWSLRNNLTFYDALYVALAEELEMALVTFDRRIAQAPGIRAAVHVLA